MTRILMAVCGILVLSTIGQWMYSIRLRDDMARLQSRVESLQTMKGSRQPQWRSAASPAQPPDPELSDHRPSTSDPGSAGAPGSADSVDAEQVRQVVADEMARRRQAHSEVAGQRAAARYRKQTERIHEQVVADLELPSYEADRLQEILQGSYRERQELFAAMHSGTMERNQLGKELKALGQRRDEAVAQLLGTERMKAYRKAVGKVLRRGRRRGPG